MEKREELATVKFLRENGLEELVSKYKLAYKRHKKFSNLVLLKYDQLESPFDSEIVQECRGLVLDESNDWKVMSYPYKKFFNYGEKNASTIDWSSAKVYEKVDGSLSIMYWYGDEWNVASSGTPDATGHLHNTRGTELENWTFRDLFWHIWNNLGYNLPQDKTKCYMFEMFSKRSKVIVMPEEDLIYLHGVRQLDSLEELDPAPIAHKNGWKLVPTFIEKFSSMEDVIAESKKLNPNKHEGFVVVDKNFRRVKIKSPQYVVMSLMSWKDRDGLNKRRMLEVVRLNEGDELISYFPQWTELYTSLKKIYDDYVNEIQNLYDKLKETDTFNNEKELSKHIKSLGLPITIVKLIWNMKRGNTESARAYFSKLDGRKLEELLPKTKLNTLPIKQFEQKPTELADIIEEK